MMFYVKIYKGNESTSELVDDYNKNNGAITEYRATLETCGSTRNALYGSEVDGKRACSSTVSTCGPEFCTVVNWPKYICSRKILRANI